jgi:hypothetical protein
MPINSVCFPSSVLYRPQQLHCAVVMWSLVSIVDWGSCKIYIAVPQHVSYVSGSSASHALKSQSHLRQPRNGFEATFLWQFVCLLRRRTQSRTERLRNSVPMDCKGLEFSNAAQILYHHRGNEDLADRKPGDHGGGGACHFFSMCLELPLEALHVIQLLHSTRL